MYNNPYNFYPYMNQAANLSFANGVRNVARPSLFAAFRNIKWGNLLTNTQKTLNVINQAIPVYYQMKPIVNNIKSFGKIMSAFNEPDTKSSQTKVNTSNIETEKKEDLTGLPTFFID